jgi:branched-chain amino acid transport system substrate-binding protein
MKRLLAVAALGAVFGSAFLSAPAHAQINVKIGVLTDMSSLYADLGGPGSVAAAKMAIADFTAEHKDIKVELVVGDHLNKPDVGSNLAGQWYDVDKVDMIIDTPNSGVALAVSQVTTQKNKIYIVSGAATSDLTGAKCNANTIHWTYDTWMLANGTGKALVKTGGDTWFFLTADYAFGQALERDTSAVVEANGGKVLGKVRHPLNTNDFSSFLLRRHPRPRSSASPMPAVTPSTRSSRRRSSASSRAGKASPVYSCSRATWRRSACPPPKVWC